VQGYLLHASRKNTVVSLRRGKLGFQQKRSSIHKLRLNVKTRKKNLSRCACTSTYRIDEDVKEIGSSFSAGELPGLRSQPEKKKFRELFGQLGGKYFDYLGFNIVNCGSLHSELIVVHSRKLSATLGG
jgi:hypothetical protein